MGLHNILTATARCPRCGGCLPTRFECDFGDTRERLELALGDRYPWRAARPGLRDAWRVTRPAGGNADGPAWAICPSCDHDYFALVRVREDVVTEVAPDRSRFPMESDASLAEALLLPCVRCGGPREMEVRLYAGRSRPARPLQTGDRYEPTWYANVTAVIWAQGLCDELHEVVVLVVVREGVIVEVQPTDIDRWVRPSERGRSLEAGPMFFDPPA